MWKFLEKSHFLTWKQEERRKKFQTAIYREIKLITKPSHKNNSRPRWFHGWILSTFKREIIRDWHKFFQKLEKEETKSRIPITHHENGIIRKENCRLISFKNIGFAKILNQILAKCIQLHKKRIRHYNQVEFIQEYQICSAFESSITFTKVTE